MPDRERQPEEDERVVAPMNVEGMPWYQPEAPKPKNPNAEPMSKRDAFRYTLSAVGAGLLIVAVFGTVAAAFVWFCCNVWFR